MHNFGFGYDKENKLRLFLVGDKITYELRVSEEDIVSPDVRERINAWAVGIATIPGGGVPLAAVEDLLDTLDSKFPPKKYSGLRRTKFFVF